MVTVYGDMGESGHQPGGWEGTKRKIETKLGQASRRLGSSGGEREEMSRGRNALTRLCHCATTEREQ